MEEYNINKKANIVDNITIILRQESFFKEVIAFLAD
jgi:hypothetical protein